MAALRVACLGECMIELREQGPGLLAQGFAGDTYNTAVYLRRLVPVEAMQIDYATAVGGDMFAPAMLQAWQREGIGSTLARHVPDRSTGLYSIRTDAQGERHFSYWRERSAARAYFEGATSPLEQQADHIDVLYLSGISLAIMGPDVPPRLETLIARLRGRGARIVFDNNYRPRLWASAETARAAFARLYELADIALVTLDDEMALHDSSADAGARAGPADGRGGRGAGAGGRHHCRGRLVRRRLPVTAPARHLGRSRRRARQPAGRHRDPAPGRHHPARGDGLGPASRRLAGTTLLPCSPT